MEILKNCYVINLEKNTERLERVTKELKKINVTFERFNAIYNEQGIVGCCMSHIECLKIAKNKNLPYVMIWEDDSVFIEDDPKKFLKAINNFTSTCKTWDVLVLSGNNFKPYDIINDNYIRVRNVQCANAYIVKRHYYQRMIDVFLISLKYLIHTKDRIYSHDNIWKYLQKKDKWYMIFPNHIIQNPGYSDIENKDVDYKEEYLRLNEYGCDLDQKKINIVDNELKNKKCIIPKKIFQTWEVKGDKISSEMQDIIDSWKKFNPGYEFHFYDKEDREIFIKNNFSKKIYDAYCRILPGAYKADLWRYCVLYIYGGIYVDIDSLCMNKLDNFLYHDTEFMTIVDFNRAEREILEGSFNLACGFIASIPKSKILENCINIIVYQVDNNIIPFSRLNFTGPGVLGRSVNVYLNLSECTSFKDKEGKHNELYLLKFEEGTEYIKDLGGNILFQNKNGNEKIKKAYQIEIEKLQKYVCWMSYDKILQAKIAIYNGFPFHYEMIGYILEYCVLKNIPLDIYTETENNMDWLKFYLLTFPKNSFKLKKIVDYNPINDYSKIILLTDDDFHFKNEWINDKVMCIDHDKENRRKQINVHVGTRYYPNRPYLEWALQVYKTIDINEKEKVSKNNIVLIGNNVRHFTNKHIDRIKNFDSYNFIFIDRCIYDYMDNSFKQKTNITVYNQISTIEMLDTLKKSHYVFITDIEYKNTERISASISLALNCLCTMIIPKEMNKYYNFRSVIEYENEIDIIEPNFHLVLEDLEYHIHHKVEVFDKYI